MKKSFRHSPHHARGFNLLELMAGITVFAVLLGIGVPSLRRMSDTNAVSAQVNEMVTALATARSEAATRGIRVSMCPSAPPQTECADPADWSVGWIVFTDDIGTQGAIDAGDTILQAWPPAKAGVALTASSDSITFLPSRAAAEVSLDIHKEGCSGEELRQVKVDIVGRVSLTKKNC